MTPELKLAEMYIASQLRLLGRTRIAYPSEELIQKRKAELVEEVEGIIGKPLKVII